MNKPLERGNQWICWPCATPLQLAAGLPDPQPMWAHIGPCELCGVYSGISKARNWGLPAPRPNNDWGHCT